MSQNGDSGPGWSRRGYCADCSTRYAPGDLSRENRDIKVPISPVPGPTPNAIDPGGWQGPTPGINACSSRRNGPSPARTHPADGAAPGRPPRHRGVTPRGRTGPRQSPPPTNRPPGKSRAPSARRKESKGTRTKNQSAGPKRSGGCGISDAFCFSTQKPANNFGACAPIGPSLRRAHVFPGFIGRQCAAWPGARAPTNRADAPGRRTRRSLETVHRPYIYHTRTRIDTALLVRAITACRRLL